MKKLKSFGIILTLLLAFIALDGLAQVPENFTSTRSAVVISVPDETWSGFPVRGNWKKTGDEVHESFRKIGVDAVVYIHKDDLTAGPEVTKSYNDILNAREIKNIVLVEVSGQGYNLEYELNIYPLGNRIELHKPYYSISASSLTDLMLVLGRQVLRQETPRTNFLIPDTPEYLDDLVLYTGTRFENVPSRLKGLKLAVTLFDTISIPKEISQMEASRLKAKNQQITRANSELKEIMKKYPFGYEFVNFKNVGSLYDNGFQYVLMPMISSGKTIKQMLNYNTNASESVYISEIAEKGEKNTLKKMPANANLTKYYIKQTIVYDIHVGSRWDADVTWQKALENFIENLKFDFNMK